MTTNISDNIQKFQDLISNAKNVLIFSHVNPDGDALGSSLALATAFKTIGIKSHVIFPNRVPENLRWLPNFDCVIEGHSKTEISELATQADLIICVDFNQWSRIERYTSVFTDNDKPLILIDHHTNPKIEATISFSDTEVSSTCELVHQILKQIPFIIQTKEYATSIYVGIITDTGMFSYSSSHANLFSTVIELINLGIEKDNITQLIYNNQSESRLRLLGYALNERMVVLSDINTAYIYLTLEDLKKHNYQPGDAENFVNYPLTINNIRFTALFQEREDEIKISFRSVGDFKVNEFAEKYFNGGGHKNAAGGKSHFPIQKTILEFIKWSKKHSHEI